MQDDFPEVVNHARVFPLRKTLISYGDNKFDEQQVIAVDNSYLTMFSCDMLAGDERTALEQPYSLVLTESRAKMFFLACRIRELWIGAGKAGDHRSP